MLAGKTILITGVGSGLGSEIASQCVRDGANVVLGARTEKQLESVAAAVDPSGQHTAYVRTDITASEDCDAIVAEADRRFGGVDALIQVAAYEIVFGDVFETDFDHWRKAFETNVFGSLNLVRACAGSMKRRGGGSIVLIGTQAMLLPSIPQMGYAASKGALKAAMLYLAKDLGADKIRVNMVVPSWMWGPPVEGYLKMTAQQEGITPEQAKARITDAFPLKEMAADEDVAQAAVFFASDRAKMITGQSLLVNAGEMMA